MIIFVTSNFQKYDIKIISVIILIYIFDIFFLKIVSLQNFLLKKILYKM